MFVHTLSDNVQEDWPVIVVTNPKDSKFLAPKVEPVQKIRESSEIRILAFSPHNISSVRVQVNQGEWKVCSTHPAIPNLYVLNWNPKLLNTKRNTLTVSATDLQERTKTARVQFQVEFDEINDDYSLYARLILMSDVINVIQFLWIFSFALSTLPVFLGNTSYNLK